LLKVKASSWFIVAAFMFLTAFKVSFMSFSEGDSTGCVPNGQTDVSHLKLAY
jgi:hypothetical protein